jgi:hypothetical protein
MLCRESLSNSETDEDSEGIWNPGQIYMIHAVAVIVTVIMTVLQVGLLLLTPLTQLTNHYMMCHLTLRRTVLPHYPPPPGCVEYH